MVLREHRGYSLDRLSPNRRSTVRRGLKRVEVCRIPDVEDLSHDGFRVYCSALRRQGRGGWRPADRRRWEAGIRATFGLPDREDWGAFAQGRMVAYLRAYVLERTMFVNAAMSDTESLGLYPNDALLHCFLEFCRNRPDIERVVHSLWSGKPSLDQFKIAFGFEVARLPVYRWIHPVGRMLLRLFPYRHLLDYDRHNVNGAPLHPALIADRTGT
jgi:hypothetical protein